MLRAIARLICRLAVLPLPPSVRYRYLEEFRAELAPLRPLGALRQSLSLILGSIRLREAVLSAASDGGRRWTCRLFLHRERVVHPNRENARIISLECLDCGRIRDPRQYDEGSTRAAKGAIGLVP